jgi:hypothetical protein
MMRRLAPDSQAAFNSLANSAQLSAALTALSTSQAMRRLAESGSLQQATLAGAVQNSVLQSLSSEAIKKRRTCLLYRVPLLCKNGFFADRMEIYFI